jgi:hypothetical protein
MASDQQLLRLARTRLGDYSFADAVAALIDVSGCTQLAVPDDLLAAAARRHLETVGAGGESDPCRALRDAEGDREQWKLARR